MLDERKKIIIIIPAFNEEKNIIDLVNNIERECGNIDFVVINDCSKDNTLKLLKEHHINYISLPINLGIGGAMQTGYKYAYEKGYDIAIQMDGDGQHDPSNINKLIDPILCDKADMTIGSRYIEKKGFQSSFMRRLGIMVLSGIMKIKTKNNVKDTTSGFRAVNYKLIEEWTKQYPTDYPEPESTAAAFLKNYRIVEVPVTMRERLYGVSSISPIKSIYYMLKVSLSIFLCDSYY